MLPARLLEVLKSGVSVGARADMNLLLGVVVAVLSGAVQSLGLTLQRKAHVINQEIDMSGRHATSWQLWRAGVLLFICANIFGSSVQLLALPLVVLCPLQAVGLVFNGVYATVLLHEPFSQLSAIGTGLVCIGAGLVAGLGAVAEPKRSLEELIRQLKMPQLQLWLLATLSLAAILFWQHYREPERRKGIFLGVISGILSSHSLLMAKSAVEMLVLVTHQPSILLRFSFWAIVLAFVLFAVAQLATANMGLKYVPTSILYPLTFCVFNLVSMCNSLVYYRDSGIGWDKVSWVLIGTVVLICGVVCLSLRYDARTSTASERSPLMDGSRYTSLDSLSPNISNPDSPVGPSFRRSKHTRRSLSKEQTELVRELTSIL